MKIAKWFTPKRTIILSSCVVVLVFVFLLLPFMAGTFIKTVAEGVASKKLETYVVLGGMYVQPLVGRARIQGLHIANPEGFGSGDAISASSVKIRMSPLAIFRENVEISQIIVSGIFIDYIKSSGGSNLDKLQSNVSRSHHKESSLDGGKLVIKKLVIEGASVRLHLPPPVDTAMTVDLPDMTLTNVGANGGVDSAQIIALMIGRMLPSIRSNMLSEVKNATKNAGERGVKNIGKDIKGVFKK
jgi:hypothetical protein